jgi:hypothetical protein
MEQYPEDKKWLWGVFTEHVIEADGPESYRYHKPGTSFYHCYIQFRHSYIIIYGDMGPFVLCTGTPNALEWAKGSVDSDDYVMGKLKNQDKLFDWGRTKKHLLEICEEDAEAIKKINEYEPADEDEAISLALDLKLDYESVCYSWEANAQAQWAYWIIRTFVDKMKVTS